LCAQAHPNLPQAHALVIGAGEMAELAVEALRKRGVCSIQVINRSLERAQTLARKWQAEAAGLQDLLPALHRADVVISSTGSPDPLIDFDTMRLAMAGRTHRPLVCMDIAVPRDIHPDVGALAGVRLYDLDDLHAHLEQSLAERRRAIPHVQAILTAEQAAFDEYFHSQELLPVIAELHQWADEIRQGELQRTLRKLPDLSPAERERIEAMTQALVRKLLDHPTRSLRAEAGRPQARARAHALRSLFGLSGGDPQP
jgi:glutamyl-tRNA reductase